MTAMDLLWMAPVFVVTLFLKGFFSGSEIALNSCDKIKMSHRARQGDRGAKLVMGYLERPERLLTTTLIGTNISTIVLTTVGTLAMISLVGSEIGDLYAVLLFTPLLLILGEIVPKSVYQQKADFIAPIVVRVLRGFAVLFSPIVFVFSRIARLAARLAGGGGTSQHLFVTREQLRSVMDLTERASGTALFDRSRIERAIRFSDMTVGQQMLPVSEMVTIASDSSIDRAIRLVRRRGYNRLPVYENNTKNIIGVATMSTWDLLDPAVHDRDLADLITPAYYVSPHDSLEDLLPTLRERDDRMAIVVDEYGSTIGMITMEDIVESVVGDIALGYEFEEYVPKHVRKYEELGDGDFLMDGRLPIHEINDLLGLNLPTKEFHTIGGMLTARLHHLPKQGESIVESGYRFLVAEATERLVKKVQVTRETLARE